MNPSYYSNDLCNDLKKKEKIIIISPQEFQITHSRKNKVDTNPTTMTLSEEFHLLIF